MTQRSIVEAIDGSRPGFSRCCGGTLIDAKNNPRALDFGVQECGICGRFVLRRNPRTRRLEWLNDAPYDTQENAA